MKKIICLAIAIMFFAVIPAAFAAGKDNNGVLAYGKATDDKVQPADKEEQRRKEEADRFYAEKKKFFEIAKTELLENQDKYKEFWSLVERTESKNPVCMEAVWAMHDLSAYIEEDIKKGEYQTVSSRIVLQFFIFMYPNVLCDKFEKAK